MERKCSDITLSFKKEFEVDWNSYVLWSNLIDFVYPNVNQTVISACSRGLTRACALGSPLTVAVLHVRNECVNTHTPL